MSDFDGREYGIGTVRGIRAFSVDEFGRLKGVQFPSIWVPGENTAKCSARMLAPGWQVDISRSGWGQPNYYTDGTKWTRDPPMVLSRPEEHGLKDCTHGFYAFYDGSNDYKSDARISAVVEGYGETLVGSRGFRAEKARIVALCFPGVDLETIESAPKPDTTTPKKPGRWLPGWPLIARITYCIAAGGATGGSVASFATDDVTRGVILGITGLAQMAMGWLMPIYPSKRKRRVSRKEREASALADIYAQRFGMSATQVTKGTVAKVRRNYPDVRVFSSFEDMVCEFPPDKGLEPSPETDPNFWKATA